MAQVNDWPYHFMSRTSDPLPEPPGTEWPPSNLPIRSTFAATPHKCPVCEGRGTVPVGFYIGGGARSVAPEQCRACDGKGVLWR